MGTPCIRWTADTERAFLLALKATGQVARAAAAIGRAPGVCYDRRTRKPAFAAAWDAALAEMEGERLAEVEAVGGTELVARPLTRARRDGWTQQRQRGFVRALADTGSYGQAAARMGISMTSVQRLRRRSGEFQALCDKALIDGGVTVEEAAYVRAVEGWEEEVYQDGKLVGTRRRFSDVLARTLLVRDADAAKRAGGLCKPPSSEELLAALAKKLDAHEAAAKRERRQAALAWTDEMARRGWAP